MKLDKYIEEYGYRTIWFAKKLGVSHNALWSWMTGRRCPSNISIQLIKMHTGGIVSEADWPDYKRKKKR